MDLHPKHISRIYQTSIVQLKTLLKVFQLLAESTTKTRMINLVVYCLLLAKASSGTRTRERCENEKKQRGM